MDDQQVVYQNGQFALVTSSNKDGKSKLYVFSESQGFIEVGSFDSVSAPTNLGIDTNDGKLKLISGGNFIGNGIELPSTGATIVESSINKDTNETTITLKNSSGAELGSTSFIAGVNDWNSIHNKPDIDSINNNINSLTNQIVDLYKHHPIEILNFKILDNNGNEISYIEENGAVILGGTLTLQWELNKKPKSLKINNTFLSNTETYIYISVQISETTEWVLSVEDEDGNVCEKAIKINFQDPIYYGMGDIEVLNSEEDKDIALINYPSLNKHVQKLKEFTVTLPENQENYIYYLSPSNQDVLKVDGFIGGFEPPKQKNKIYTGSDFSAVQKTYYIYKSINKFKGVEIKVEIV